MFGKAVDLIYLALMQQQKIIAINYTAFVSDIDLTTNNMYVCYQL